MKLELIYSILSDWVDKRMGLEYLYRMSHVTRNQPTSIRLWSAL